jgi:hypothetical protein
MTPEKLFHELLGLGPELDSTFNPPLPNLRVSGGGKDR